MIIVGSIVDIDEAKEIEEIAKISILVRRIKSLVNEIVIF